MKLIVTCKSAEKRVRTLMQETLLGPEIIDPDIDFASSVKSEDRPDLAKEMAYFRTYNGT